MLLNNTYTIQDIFEFFLKTEKTKEYKSVEEVVYQFLENRICYTEEVFLFKFREEDFTQKFNRMIEDIKSNISGKFTIEAVNFNEHPSVGLMIAIAVTSTKYPEEEPMTEGLCSEYGKLCYVYNWSYPNCSELGDCFFTRDEKNDYKIIRIG